MCEDSLLHVPLGDEGPEVLPGIQSDHGALVFASCTRCVL